MKTAWIIIFGATLLWSGIEPKDRLTWVLEAGPAVIGLIVMGKTRIGTQGYAWDTQSDMALALAGSIICLISLRNSHDKQLAKLHPPVS